MAHFWGDMLDLIFKVLELVGTLLAGILYMANGPPKGEEVEPSTSKYICNKETITESEMEVEWKETAKDFEEDRLSQGLTPYSFQLLHWNGEGHVVWEAVEALDKGVDKMPLPDISSDDTTLLNLPERFKLHKWYLTKSFDWLKEDREQPSQIFTSDIISSYVTPVA